MKTALTTLAALVAVALLVVALPAANVAAEGDGEGVFLGQKCNTCHSVEAAGIEAKTKSEKIKGPDLTGVTDRHDNEWLARYLHKEEELNGSAHKGKFSGSDEELQALLSWLAEQKG